MLPITLDGWNGLVILLHIFFISITHHIRKQFQNCRRINCGRSHLKQFNETAFEDEGSRDNICIIDNDITGKSFYHILYGFIILIYTQTVVYIPAEFACVTEICNALPSHIVLRF